MLQNYSKSRWWMFLFLPAWVFVSFFVSQAIVTGIVWLLAAMHVPLASYNQAVLSASLAAILYVITLALVIGVPWLMKKRRVSQTDIGLTRLPSWTDILITPAGLIIYFILSSLLILLATRVLPWFDVNQVQDTGFRQLSGQYEYILAFATLVVIAPVAEEVLFRGYLYGKLKKFVPIWVAILATSILFGSIHGAWNLAIDTFALSIVLCLLRESTGNIWASILLHMAKNGIAFYILFINPTIFTTLGG
ncbi:MAG TPA: type II CAAX endopeptidase family protein [Candidatus Angelobacter sp.]|nr:type II CAAX endopeptidase family protein [Candidatus Angelobacter sp.]